MESPFCQNHPECGDPRDDPDFRLIETFGVHPGRGIARLDLHLARMARSAIEMDIPFDVAAVKAALDTVQSETALRCRLTLGPDGAFAVTTAAFPAPLPLMRFKIAETVLNSQDIWLQHKTTRRKLYDRARADLPAGLDEQVFLNERGELCEGTITNIVLTTAEGQKLTPPVQSGCLPGVFRQSLLAEGRVQEAILTLDDLQEARDIHLTNSLRGASIAQWVRS